MKALARRIRAWWNAGLQPGSNPTPAEAEAIREIERYWRQP